MIARRQRGMRYIEEDPHYPVPEDARVAKYGVPVWALISYLHAVNGDVERVATDYDMSVEHVQAAIAYYKHHKDRIDMRIEADSLVLV